VVLQLLLLLQQQALLSHRSLSPFCQVSSEKIFINMIFEEKNRQHFVGTFLGYS
jgi:hypothetical protein